MRVAMLTVWRYLTRCRVATFAMASSKDLFEAYLSKHGYLSTKYQCSLAFTAKDGRLQSAEDMRVAMLTVWRYLTRCRVATFTMASSKDLFEAYLSKHGYLSLQNGKILFFGYGNLTVSKKEPIFLVFFCSGKLTVSKKEKTFCFRFLLLWIRNGVNEGA
ncbi:hypothetical protein TNCT_365441 [Trichonephila clavata]|uniref:Uncharacterized protein n=1 Tax=Trichonephila clavata TaxID=2740835 RepID=A0A8X6M456_TRICU|nr:hypothetical protein TNCT_365441 [Trichonephila clavata]